MAFIVFKAKQEFIAACELQHGQVLGRSMDCDIYVPDVFVSRQHVRFERSGEGWSIIDLDSRNGLFFHGVPIRRRPLKHGDVVELGTVQIIFNEGDLPAGASKPAPFGLGPAFGELVDTVYGEGLRPMEYIRKNMRKPRWMRVAEAAQHADRLPVSVPLEEKEPEEWTELDVELQLKESIDDFIGDFEEEFLDEDITDWRLRSLRLEEVIARRSGRPIERRMLTTASAGAATDDNGKAVVAETKSRNGASLLERKRPKRISPAERGDERRDPGSIDEPVGRGNGKTGFGGRGGNMWEASLTSAAVAEEESDPRNRRQRKKEAREAARKKAKSNRVVDGVEIQEGESLLDRVKDVLVEVKAMSIRELIMGGIAAIIARPITVAVTLAVMLALTVAVYRYTDTPQWEYRNVAPVMDSEP